MNRSELIAAAAQRANLSSADAAATLDALLETIAEAVSDGDRVTIPGFGVFERRERAARSGRNPRTGEAMEIASSKAPAFKAGAAFKRRVAGE